MQLAASQSRSQTSDLKYPLKHEIDMWDWLPILIQVPLFVAIVVAYLTAFDAIVLFPRLVWVYLNVAWLRRSPFPARNEGMPKDLAAYVFRPMLIQIAALPSLLILGGFFQAWKFPFFQIWASPFWLAIILFTLIHMGMNANTYQPIARNAANFGLRSAWFVVVLVFIDTLWPDLILQATIAWAMLASAILIAFFLLHSSLRIKTQIQSFAEADHRHDDIIEERRTIKQYAEITQQSGESLNSLQALEALESRAFSELKSNRVHEAMVTMNIAEGIIAKLKKIQLDTLQISGFSSFHEAAEAALEEGRQLITQMGQNPEAKKAIVELEEGIRREIKKLEAIPLDRDIVPSFSEIVEKLEPVRIATNRMKDFRHALLVRENVNNSMHEFDALEVDSIDARELASGFRIDARGIEKKDIMFREARKRFVNHQASDIDGVIQAYQKILEAYEELQTEVRAIQSSVNLTHSVAALANGKIHVYVPLSLRQNQTSFLLFQRRPALKMEPLETVRVDGVGLDLPRSTTIEFGIDGKVDGNVRTLVFMPNKSSGATIEFHVEGSSSGPTVHREKVEIRPGLPDIVTASVGFAAPAAGIILAILLAMGTGVTESAQVAASTGGILAFVVAAGKVLIARLRRRRVRVSTGMLPATP